MLEAAVKSYIEDAPTEDPIPNTTLWKEHGVYFAGQQFEHGRLVLGWGDSIAVAVGNAIRKYEG